MKLIKYSLLAVALFASASAFAQGQINFANRITGTVDAAIKDVGGAANASGANGFFAQLYAGLTDGSLAPIGSPIALRSDAGIGYVAASVVTTSFAGGTLLRVMMVGWSGATSYNLAKTTLGAKVGQSTTIGVTIGDPNATPPGTPANLIGLQGFTVTTVVPEPSVIALGVLGLGALALRRKTA